VGLEKGNKAEGSRGDSGIGRRRGEKMTRKQPVKWSQQTAGVDDHLVLINTPGI